MAKGHFRYRFSPQSDNGGELVYFPFWRLKGMMFSSVPTGIRHRFLDISHQAMKSNHFPVSVGVRSQALKLKFITPEDKGTFLRPEQSLSTVMDIIATQYESKLPKPILYSAFIGETASLIYSPFYIRNGQIFDAILGKPINATPIDNLPSDFFNGTKPDWGIRLLPTLCPSCGWDMEAEKASLVLACHNCESVWRISKEKFQAIKVAHIPRGEEGMVYLPFWRVKADIKGIALKTYADFVRAANLPKVVLPYMEDQEFRFWGAAFKVRPNTYFNLCNGLTHAQFQDELAEKMPKGKYLAVTLPVGETLESLKLIIAGFLRPQVLITEILPDIRIHPKTAKLVYIPFREKVHELVQEQLNLAVNKNQLKLASNL